MILSILSSIVRPVVNYFTKRSEHKTDIKKKNIDRIINAEDRLQEWEKVQAERIVGKMNSGQLCYQYLPLDVLSLEVRRL